MPDASMLRGGTKCNTSSANTGKTVSMKKTKTKKRKKKSKCRKPQKVSYTPDPQYIMSEDSTLEDSYFNSQFDVQFENSMAVLFSAMSVLLNIAHNVTSELETVHSGERPFECEKAGENKTQSEKTVDEDHVIGIGTSLVSGLGLELQKLGIENTAFCYRGSDIPRIQKNIPNIIPHELRDKQISIYLQCAGNDCENNTASAVINRYHDLIESIRGICPKASNTCCKIPKRLKNRECSLKIDKVNTYLSVRSIIREDVHFTDMCPAPIWSNYKSDGVHLKKHAKEVQA